MDSGIRCRLVLIFLFWIFTTIVSSFNFPTDDFDTLAGHRVTPKNDEDNGDFHSVYKRSTVSPPTTSENTQGNMPKIEVPKGYSIHDPPPTLEASGTLVEFGVMIFSVRDIKEINEQISLELRLQVSWKDSRLAEWLDHIEDNKTYTVINPVIMDQIWHPDIFIDYVKAVGYPLLLSKPASLRFYKDMQLRYSARTTITMSCPMAFHFYPADTQRCIIDMKSYSYNSDVLRLDWSKKKPLVLQKPNMDLPNFHLELAPPEKTIVQTSAGFYTGVRLTVLLRRSMKYHLIQTYLPSTLFVIVSWLSFLVPPEMVPGRMAICMTTLLTLTAMFSAVRQNIPKVSYIKALDIWMVTCAFFVFLTLLEYTIVLKFRAKRAEEEKKKAIRNAKMAAALIGQDINSEKPYPPAPSSAIGRSPDPPQPISKPMSQSTFILEEVIEHYTWMVVISLFVIFNCVYWPWLLLSSGYYDKLGDTKYY